ncbi:MAG TPA: dihydroxyacetone kinase subunit DhaL [Beutenbergiaceae bacterium]|nr:dihydroxyacetone kinase subunit DhaL [Beutenbergiaceae bacterium]
MAQTLDLTQLRQVLIGACQAIIDAREELTRADRAIGDGDHGSGMSRGFTAARDALQEAELSTAGDAFKTVGSAVLASSGGASGAVFGTMFRAPGKVLQDQVLTADGLSSALQEAAAGVRARGRAEPGQKTMLDALVPAAQAAQDAQPGGLLAVARAAADAAAAGSAATTDLVARVGKAKSLGERSLGHRDPGAISVAILLEAIAEGIEEV